MHRHVSPQLGRSGTSLSAVDAAIAVDAVVDPAMDVASLARSEPSTADRTVVQTPAAATTDTPGCPLVASRESSSLNTADDRHCVYIRFNMKNIGRQTYTRIQKIIAKCKINNIKYDEYVFT